VVVMAAGSDFSDLEIAGPGQSWSTRQSPDVVLPWFDDKPSPTYLKFRTSNQHWVITKNGQGEPGVHHGLLTGGCLLACTSPN
jgi:hypothetical protein